MRLISWRVHYKEKLQEGLKRGLSGVVGQVQEKVMNIMKEDFNKVLI